MKKYISSFATAVSIISLAALSELPDWSRWLFALVGVLCLVYLLIDDYKSSRGNQRICKSDKEIREAMRDLIRIPGKVCIMSRDLSWVDEETKACLQGKRDDILIFAQKPSPLTRELQAWGVKVKFYNKYGFEPKTRFTIVRYGHQDPQVAIANTQHSVRSKNEFKHTIYQTTNDNDKDDWINSITVDLVNLCNAVCEE